MKIDPVFLNVISDLFINLSAGWIGAAVVLPSQLMKQKRKKWWSLSVNIVCAILSIVAAYQLKRFQ